MKKLTRVKEVDVYQCDYCDKEGFHKGEMELHESSCKQRVCEHTESFIRAELSRYEDDEPYLYGFQSVCKVCRKVTGRRKVHIDEYRKIWETLR